MGVFCPLCDQISFASLDALRCSLIKVANEPLPCPVCHKLYLGLDKLTIHLFSHANINHIRAIVPPNSSTSKPAEFLSNNKVEKDEILNQPQSSKEQIEGKSLLQTNPNREDLYSSKGSFKVTDNKDISDANENKPIQNNHQSHHHLEANFKCHLCTKAFAMKGSLRIHLKVVHCIGLPRGFNLKQLNNSNTKLQTALCDSFLLNHEPDLIYSNKNYKKLLSNLDFRELPVNNQHSGEELIQSYNNKSKHQQEQMEEQQQCTEDRNSHMPIGEDLQAQQIPSIQLVNSMNGVISQFNSSSSSSSSSLNCSNGDHIKLWECDVCTKSFTTKYFLKKHKRLHTGEMPYSCEICGRTFTFQQSYHKHLLYHSDDKPHACTTCGRSFKELSTLHNHERIHSGEKPFKCDICGKCFRQRVSCLVHKRIHTGVMPYKCENCQKSFRYKVSQRTHKCVAFATDAITSSQGETLEELTDNFIKSLLEDTNSNANVTDQTQSSQTKVDGVLDTNDNTGRDIREQHDNRSEDSYQTFSLATNSTSDTANSTYLPISIQMNDGNFTNHGPTHTDQSDGCISPTTSQRLQDMRIYSPQLSHSIDLGADYDSTLTGYLFQQIGVDDDGLSSLL